ncbi:putative kinesin [Aspergillus bombycis]|uniref:Putative kinesin n=1 Tax=Aspergillus bombycis TaxID=109264 RepID=A0A1F8A8D1_9EURO|nr:putative kinesin [Aspergillus bombycis]OGM47679.1 putative kinesin [Aspergillus bombycis]
MEQKVSTGEPNVLDKTGLCLLSLDGGGVRGLSTLYILKHLMARLSYERPELGKVKPCEVFDLIGGTSTGGLIAIMLGRLEMSVDECIDTYVKLISTVFEKKSRWPVNLSGNVRSRFDATKLESAIKDVVTSHGAKETDLFNDGCERGCRVFVCTTSHETKDIVRLRDYSVPSKDNIPATICQAALATSAATTFFNPVYIGTRKFVDGALGSNNPVDEVEGEAADIWCPGTGDLKPLVKCFISIGTGDPGITAIEDKALKFLSETLVSIVTETGQTEKKFIARWAKHYDDKRYFRFNVEQGLQGVGLEEYREQGTIEAATHRYLDHQTQVFRVRDCVENLKLKRGMAMSNISRILGGSHAPRSTQVNIPSSPKAPWTVPFRRNPLFVSRSAEIARVDDILSNDSEFSQVAIVGLGGVGKTQIALEYAHILRERHADCAIFWIPATSIESMLEAYLQIARELQIPYVGNEINGIQTIVQHRLSQESSGKWLLVLDNADDTSFWADETKDTAGYSLPKSKHGSILFTTRSHKTAVKLVGRNIVKVKAMNNTLAKNLLRNTLIDWSLLADERASAELLQKLTYLPLAIVQAAAFINKNQMTLSEYISLHDTTEESTIGMLSQDFEDEGRYEDGKNPIAATWLISFEQIQASDTLAAEYLSLMACVEPKNIPRIYLPLTHLAAESADALGTLKAFSFIASHENSQLLDIHRLVHLATRNWLRMQGTLTEWTDKALSRMNVLFPIPKDENRHMWRLLLPHARYILESLPWNSPTSAAIHLLHIFGYGALRDGRYEEARRAFNTVTDFNKRSLGIEHPVTLSTQADLANVYFRQGEWSKAEELSIQTLGSLKKVVGIESLVTLTSMSVLVSIYCVQERWAKAEKLEQETLKAYESVLGAEHPETLANKSSIARIYKGKGNWNKARKLDLQILKCHRTALGMDHPLTLTSTRLLAEDYVYLGLLRKAEALQKQATETSKRVLGAEHPDTIFATGTLASIYRDRGRLGDAEKLQIWVLKSSREVLGAEHPYTIWAMASLADTWRRMGRYTEATDLLEKCLQLEMKVLGAYYSDTLKQRRKLRRGQMHQQVISGCTPS